MAGLVTTETAGLNTINFANRRISLPSGDGCVKASLRQPGENAECRR